MALERKDRAQDSTTTTGTNNFELAGTSPDAGYLPFVSVFTSGATVRYLAISSNSSEWEVGEGIFTDATPDTLTRVTIYSSSNSGNKVDFSAGIKKVYNVLTAADMFGTNSIISNETPSGDLDGSDTTYTLANSPATGTLKLYLNGQRLTYTTDYTLATNVITFVVAPVSGDILRADYEIEGAGAGNADTLDNLHATSFHLEADKASGADINTGTNDAKHVTAKAIKDSIIFNAPQGFLLNGKIVPSVASNNLTVAIKGLDGNDPSATNPVYCRIGDTVHSITSPLSVTVNAAVNTFNAGSAELATKEIDCFAYLGYNATDGVVIGISRIPFANSYDDFSATATNEKYCAISTITNAAATDYYEVIGRFAATLSAGAGYTWSVPTYTAINLVQKPIFKTRTLSFVPTIANLGAGTAPAFTNKVGLYTIIDNLCSVFVNMDGDGGTDGSGAGWIGVKTPISISSVITNTTQSIGQCATLIGAGATDINLGIYSEKSGAYITPRKTITNPVTGADYGNGGRYLTFSANYPI